MSTLKFLLSICSTPFLNLSTVMISCLLCSIAPIVSVLLGGMVSYVSTSFTVS